MEEEVKTLLANMFAFVENHNYELVIKLKKGVNVVNKGKLKRKKLIHHKYLEKVIEKSAKISQIIKWMNENNLHLHNEYFVKKGHGLMITRHSLSRKLQRKNIIDKLLDKETYKKIHEIMNCYPSALDVLKKDKR